ncbi:uncharacterized protein J3D65DRAFT_407012 [Phyllosticta citribraziliensis]|uniref:Uncharacterized protein n=1 Tax=Phyllosticta citribraziliensis TaxID=989973 RepID=A0ABR1LLW1_9PEZI
MGRKPNQLILEFFERGPKLEDASNRYQHTCRSCGERFPKGRIDTLTAHLVKKCPALTSQDRQRAILQFHDLPVPDLPPSSSPAQPSSVPASASPSASAQSGGQNNGAQNAKQPMTLPYAAPKAGMSRLEALAEVSRQRLDLSGQRIPTPDGDHSERRGSIRDDGQNVGQPVYEDFLVQDHEHKPATDANANGAAEPGSVSPHEHLQQTSTGTLRDHLLQELGKSKPPQSPVTAANGARNLAQSTENNASQQQQAMQVDGPAPGSPHPPAISAPPPSTTPPTVSAPTTSTPSASSAHPHPSPLVMTASAAEELRASMPNQPNEAGYHQGQPGTNWPQAIDPLLQHLHDPGHTENDNSAAGNNGSANYRPLAINPAQQAHFTTDFSMSPKPNKPKVRGRFSDVRRKEVQEVRKRGACIRCRMLKKPCSGESPCSTCQNVESARLWKHPCIRTRIAEEFGLYAAGLHAVLAFHSISSTKAQFHFEHVHGRIEARLDLDPSMYATFTTLKGMRPAGAPIDPAIYGSGLQAERMQYMEIIDPDVEDVGGKLELFLKRMGPAVYESEVSPFMKPTLVMAHRQSVENKEGFEHKEGLLTKVLELWVATRILSEPSLKFQLFFNHMQPPFQDPVIMSPQELESIPPSSRFPIEPSTHPESYKLVDAQILGALEKRAAQLSKHVMNDLERRLLQRQQANPFETFLVSMILLACVERMCWLFKRWENPSPAIRQYSVPPPPGSDLKTELERSIAMHNAAAAANPEAAGPEPQAPPQAQDSQPNQDPSLQHQHHGLDVNGDRSEDIVLTSPRPNRWPLDKPPASYSQQGERFSDILHMLLKMRGVPPKTTTEPITNVVVPIDNMTNNVTSNATINPRSEELAKEWFAAVRITPMWLAERRNASGVWGGEDPREWEGLFVSKVLVHNGIVEGTGRLVP